MAMTAQKAKTYTREDLSDDEFALLYEVGFSESGQIERATLTDRQERMCKRFVRKGLLYRYPDMYEITLAGRYIVEPEATTELYGPQDGHDPFVERNFAAEAAEIRSEYRYEDDDRYQMSDAEAEYRASMDEAHLCEVVDAVEMDAAERERQGCTDDMYCVCDSHAKICPTCGARYSADDMSLQFEVDDYARCGHVTLSELE